MADKKKKAKGLCKLVIAQFDNGNFDKEKIAGMTGAAKGTINVQYSLWCRKNPSKAPKKVKKEKKKKKEKK